MGFTSYHEAVQNPAQKYYRWSGGLKDVEMPDGTTAKQLKGELAYWDGEKMVKVDLPFQFCVLEQTRSATGFMPTPGQTVRYYSNECVNYNDIMSVYRKEGESAGELIYRGTWGNYKTKPQGLRLQVHAYIFNPISQQIERFNLSGSSLGAFIDFTKKHKGLYDHSTIIEAGEITKRGSVEFIPPKFSMGAEYTKEELDSLSKQDAIVIAYLKDLARRNEENNVAGSGVDQTPAQYQGEENQETGGEGEDETIDLSEVPF